VEVNGVRVLVILAIPVAITIAGWLVTIGRLPHALLPIACGLMWIWTLLTGFSVGLLYLPVDGALVVALAACPKSQRHTRNQTVR
jgi:FtsH-binding integral membrane protein